MSDEELSNALQSVLGIFGGSGRPWSPIDFLCRIRPAHLGRAAGLPEGKDDDPVDHRQASERRDGAQHRGPGQSVVNHVSEKPLFQGKATIAMARLVYKISDPNNRQMELFQ